MEHYITLFNSLFLPQGLALHMSMERHVRDYVLWILCVDDEAHDVLTQLALPNVRLLKLSELETEELRTVKPTRTIGEYCWTLTPFAPRFVFESHATVNRVTYLDADLWFRKHPKPIFDEFDRTGKHVLITDHAYAPEYDQSATSGQFCVQFMTFTRDGGEVVRKWWEERCIEWCFARFEDSKFGDQKYLDDFPRKFDSAVHVLKDKELALAPWNAERFPYAHAVFYHFHSVRIVGHRKMQIGEYHIPIPCLRFVYMPYKIDLGRALEMLHSLGLKEWEQAPRVNTIKRLYRKIKRVKRAIHVAFSVTELRI